MYFGKRGLILLLITLTAFAFGNISTKQKQSSPNRENPFHSKFQKHYRSISTVAKRQSINMEEMQAIPAKVAAFKARLVQSNPALQEKRLEHLTQISDGTVQVRWNESNTLPIFIKGKKLQQNSLLKSGPLTDTVLAKRAKSFLQENAGLLQLENPDEEFVMTQVLRDTYGLTHIRYQQMYAGLEIWGRDIAMHLNANGFIESFNGRYIATPKGLQVNLTQIDKAGAIEIAKQIFDRQPNETTARKIIFVDNTETSHITWLVNLKKGLSENRYYFVDAMTGDILKSYNHIMTDGPVQGSGVDLAGNMRTINAYQIGSEFLLIDTSKLMFNAAGSTFPDKGKGVIYTRDAQNGDIEQLFYIASNDVNSWNNPNGVSASANGALVYEYFSQVHGRNAIDGLGTTMNIVINFQQDLNNAFWTGQFMVFGNGDGTDFSDLAGALDVTGHEMSHGVIERTANLVYENQPGALNESFADVFGALFEFWVEGETNGDWLMGEEVTTPGTPGDALRDMENPASDKVAFGKQPTKMSEFVNLPNTEAGDNGGVHTNSGITNRAFYLFATAIGISDAEKVYFHALTNYLTRNSKFIDCRLAVIKSAEDLFGNGSAQAVAAAQAFDTVEIFDGQGTPDPGSLPPVEGTEFLTVIDQTNDFLFRSSTDGQDFVQLSSVSTSGSRPAITDNGSFVFYIDNEDNIRLVDSQGIQEAILTSGGVYNHVAISPNGQFLAVTTTLIEENIYVVDLDDPNGQFVQIPLYTPTTGEGETIGTVLFPDRIDWASDNETLMYDAFNIFIDTNGDTTGFWDINLLRASDGLIVRLFPPQPPGIDIGNAVFASNSDNIIAFDHIDENFNVTVLAVNLNSGDVGVVTDNANSLGSPSFSRDDDRIYTTFSISTVLQQSGTSIWKAMVSPVRARINALKAWTVAFFRSALLSVTARQPMSRKMKVLSFQPNSCSNKTTQTRSTRKPRFVTVYHNLLR